MAGASRANPAAMANFLVSAFHGIAVLARAMKKSIRPEAVAHKIIQAIEARNPAFRYPVGPDTKLISRLRRFAPTGLFSRIMRREFDLNKARKIAHV